MKSNPSMSLSAHSKGHGHLSLPSDPNGADLATLKTSNRHSTIHFQGIRRPLEPDAKSLDQNPSLSEIHQRAVAAAAPSSVSRPLKSFECGLPNPSPAAGICSGVQHASDIARRGVVAAIHDRTQLHPT